MKTQTKSVTEQIVETGKRLAKIRPNSQALKNAREWWKSGSRYSNHDFDVLQAMSSELYDWNAGYREGYAGRTAKINSDAYLDGYDIGNCDRPSLDELKPLDIGKEQSAWYL